MSNTVDQESRLAHEEARNYRELSSRLKFRQNLAQGLGGATVFGMVLASGQALFTAAKAALLDGGMVAALPWAAGLFAIAVVGVGCLYLASRYFAESVRVDQIHQAKQITKGINGRAPVVEQKPEIFPAVENAPDVNLAGERALQGRVVPIAAAKQVGA